MFDQPVIYLGAYVAVAYLLLNFLSNRTLKETTFALLNAGACGWVFFTDEHNRLLWLPVTTCVALLVTSYAVLRWRWTSARYWPALMVPIAFLVVGKAGYSPVFVGLSYLAFRLSYLVHEVSIGKVAVPSFFNYVSFAVFPLTFPIGPISPYRLYDRSLESSEEAKPTPYLRAFGRLLVGVIKIELFGEMLEQLSFSTLWMDGYDHGIGDFVIACVGSYLHLYCNFSGACDVVIGTAAFLDIPVAENFDRPLSARNLREFWERFHMTLTNFMREIFFLPITLFLTRLTNGRGVHVITMTALLINFFLIGVWHGTDKSFLVLGVLHGTGVALFYLFNLVVKALPPSVRWLFHTKAWTAVGTLLTFAFVSFSCLFFENDWNTILAIYDKFVFAW